MNDVRTDIIEEALVVGDDQQSFLPVLQVVIQPDNGIQI